MEHKKQRRRASSAKPSQDNNRRNSEPLTKQVNKIDWLQNLYGGIFNTKKDRNSKAIHKLLYGIGQENDALNSTSRKYKDSEQLYQENINLKRQLNNLKKEVQLQKGKTEVFRRKNSEYTKKLSIEYEKEMYWGPTSSNMVMGIKNQYETIKQKYNQKYRECEEMAKDFVLCQNKEDKLYIKALEEDNIKLKNNLKQAREEMKMLHHGTITSEVQEGLDAYKRWKFQLQQININLQSQIQLLKAQNKGLSNIIETYSKKIEFLDRLIIEKDNAEHAARKKLKKLQKQKQDIMDVYTIYKNQNQQKVAYLEQKIKKIKENAEKQAQRQITIFRKQLQEKNDRVNKLEKQIAYLTTLLSYWKPLDQLNELVTNKMLDNANLSQDHNFLLQYSKSIGGSMMQFNKSRQQNQIHIEEDDAKSITNSIIHRSNRHSIAGSRKGSVDAHKNLLQNRNISDLMTKSIDLPKQLQVQRMQITADKRHSQNSVKCRKVHHDEIVDICQYLKYRFIGLNIGIEEIKSMFDFKMDENDILMTEEEEQWNKQYINLEETKQILSNRKIFGLNETDVQTLARYLIEDSQNDYVYCDPANQNLRNVVKSILKNIIGGYTTQHSLADLRARAEETMNKYQTNLESALKTTAPKGLLSKKKLLELFKGLGIELTPEFQDYYLGKLAVKSENLSTLKYQILFEK